MVWLNKDKMRNIFFMAVALVVLSACKTLIPFTGELKSSNNWKDKEVKQLQYYNSEAIVLNRQLKSNETGIVSGKIKMVDGKQVEQITIRKGTPGIISTIPDSERMAISFEIGDDHFLTFGVDNQRGGRYYLRLKDYEKNKFAIVTYFGKSYNISPTALNAYLQVNLKKINREKTDLRVAKGRKL
jgi:hypothetical protein